MNDILLVCYSRTGNTHLVADELARLTGWPLALISDSEPRAGLTGDLRCMYDAFFKTCPTFHYQGPDLDRFEHVVLLTPVWMKGLAAPLRAFLSEYDLGDKRVSVICTQGGRGGFNAVEEIATLTGQIPSPVQILLQREVLSGLSPQSLEDFVVQVLASSTYQRDRQRSTWLSPVAS
ncbi:flavodoxin family protein [Aquipseudomonas ullengensis]|uniref:Flavodoxin family protein n=1 Tax=Aquipseudomonas ullengensis TaxID=2759166 RepID=A0A7W4QB49_9GAMM|nr:flavodoxin family protein [Pseudomonas ullengensis]MBB2496532.1 flavodoxin family protein [Pseudomonas ullengensis]